MGVDFFTNAIKNINIWTCFITAIGCFALIMYFKRNPSLSKLVPRASGNPIRHLLDFLREPHVLFENLTKKHGGIFSIGFAGNVIVLTNWDCVKEFLKMDGMSDRALDLVNLCDDFDSVFEVNGKPWEVRRKFAINILRCLNLSRSTEDLITSEVCRVLNSVDKVDLSEDVNFHKLLASATNNVGLSTICGKSYEPGHPMSDFILDFNASLMNIFRYRPIAKAIGFSPSIFSLFSPTYRKSVKIMNKMADFIRSEIEAHAKTLDDQNPGDLIDYALIEMGKSSETSKIKKTNEIVGDSMLMLVAGTDTVRITSEWMFLLLAQHQDMQDKIYKEIVHVYGDRKPTWEQHTNLPFTEAFIAESQRFKTIIPMLTPRKTPRDIKIQGYDVPKDSYVFNILHCVHMDEQVYKDPKTFDPTRFLSVDGSKVVIPEYFVPFSYGNRNCLGDKIGRMEIFLILTGLVQQYRVLAPKGGVNLEETLVMELVPVHPYIKLQKRI